MNRLSTIALSAALILAISGCERSKAAGMKKPSEGPIPVTATEVKTGNFPAVLEATGKTQAYNTVQIFARVNGYLAKRHYTEGSFVTKGTPLFTIDPSDLKNSLATAQAAYDLASANYTNAKATLNRIKPLAQANAASQQELDSATAAERNGAAALEGAKATLDQAKLNLSYTTIKAPMSGYVDQSKVDVGTYVVGGANGLLTTMYQNDPIYVNFTFSENERIARQNAITSGKLVVPKDGKYDIELILADGSTLSRKGSIDFIAPFIDSTTGTITYRAILENSDHKLLPGQFVKVRVTGMEWKNTQYLPQKTVLSGEKGKFVYVIEANNTVSTRPVTVGAWVGENIVIERGLTGDEKIAADALPKLKPGAPVIVNGQ
ncbi:MAG: efflux RND transporter periplasmic adaptor subunit [Sulfuricurvum sp.]|nr:efflux RND transporter periplasmic adaptor subunit [Sulfuricurvum sp.]